MKGKYDVLLDEYREEDSGASALSQLADISLSGVQVGQVLKWNGTKWFNASDNSGEGGGSSIVFTETETGDTISAALYPSGTFLVNTVAKLTWINVMQSYWLIMGGGGGANVITDLMTESGLQLLTESGLVISIN